MVIPKHIIGRISRMFKQNFEPYERVLVKRKQKRLVSKILMGFLKRPSAYVSEVARTLPRSEGSLENREQKLLRFLHPKRSPLAKPRAAHLSRLPGVCLQGRAPRIYADLSDCSKPWARKMDALDTVRDGSDPDEKLQPGYWVNEVYVAPEPEKLFPAILYPFSTQEKGFRSQNQVILEHMEEVFGTLKNRGIWISDRGYDNQKFLT